MNRAIKYWAGHGEILITLWVCMYAVVLDSCVQMDVAFKVDKVVVRGWAMLYGP